MFNVLKIRKTPKLHEFAYLQCNKNGQSFTCTNPSSSFKVEDYTKHLNKIMQPTHEQVEITRDKYNNMWVEAC